MSSHWLLNSLVLLNIIALLGVLLVVWLAWHRHRQRRDLQQALVERYTRRLPQAQVYAVRAAGEQRFRRWLKFFPWNAVGVMVIDGDELLLELVDAGGRSRRQRWPRADLKHRWLGRQLWPNGALVWFRLQTAGQVYYLTSETGLSVIDSERSTKQIYSALAAADPGFDPQSLSISNDFALEKHPLSLAMLIGFGLLSAYALIDGVFLNQETYVGPAYALPGALIALIVFGAAFLISLASSIPRLEAMVLSLLLALMAGAATYPGWLRLNQLSDRDGLVKYDYSIDLEAGLLRPDNPDLPTIEIDLRRLGDYWREQPQTASYPVELRHGGLGFYQVNMAPIIAAAREFYRRRHDDD
ncbi:MAG: hypothetical protein Tsb002_12490 [Wenzhouxiangellaceae bacterium]